MTIGLTSKPEIPYADDRNFCKVEEWTKDGSKIDRLIYAGNNLEKARALFADAIKHRPKIRLTIRQRTRVLEQWPRSVSTRSVIFPALPLFALGGRAGP